MHLVICKLTIFVLAGVWSTSEYSYLEGTLYKLFNEWMNDRTLSNEHFHFVWLRCFNRFFEKNIYEEAATVAYLSEELCTDCLALGTWQTTVKILFPQVSSVHGNEGGGVTVSTIDLLLVLWLLLGKYLHDGSTHNILICLLLVKAFFL